VLGVRPEHVRPWTDGLLGPIEGRVAFVEQLGRETLVGVDTADGARLVTVVEGRARYDIGDPLRLGLVESGVRRFPA
jgi:multiple sugar transport system ATP-binding protein